MKYLASLLLCWTVMGSPTRIIDGDTFEAHIKIWQQIAVVERVRLLGIDAPEITGPTKTAGLAAKKFTEAWLAKGDVQITSCKRDSFGRVLGHVSRGEENLRSLLEAAGHVAQ